MDAPSLDAVLKAKAGRTLTVERGDECDKYTVVACCTVESPVKIVGRALGAESIGWPFFPCETHTTLRGVPVANSRSGRELGVALPTVQRQP